MAATANTDGARSFQLMNSAVETRYFDQVLMMTGNAAGLAGLPRSGVFASVYAAGFASTPLDLYTQAQTSPNLSVQVQAGAAFIGRSAQGGYTAYNSAPDNLTVTTPSTTLPRIDLVYYGILDQALSDPGAPTIGGYAQLGIEAGTPASSPVAPALPANAIPLAQVAVAANATSITQANITQVRRGTAVRGTVRPMLEGDLLADVGYCYGEKRSRVHGTYGYLEDYWGTDAAWHGMPGQTLVIPTGSYPLTAGSSMLVATTYILGQTTIADPGYPYYLDVSASSAFYSDTHAGTMPVRIRLDNASTGTIVGASGVQPAGGQNYANIAGVRSALLTGSHTVYWVYQPTATASACNYPGNDGTCWVTCRVVPE